MPLFHKQQNHSQLLTSLIIALTFTTPLESKYVQTVIAGCSTNTRFYLSHLKKTGYVEDRQGLLHLSEKARLKIESLPFEITPNPRGVRKSGTHELLLIRTLFLCLLHLDLQNITQVQKEKPNNRGQIPDLSIITKDYTLYIEVDTGSQPIKTIETKIQSYNLTGKDQKTVIYFTDSWSHFNYFKQKDYPQFICLQSPTIIEDILKLKPDKHYPISSKYVDNPLYYRIAPNVLVRKDLIPDELERKRQEFIKKFNKK